MNDMIERSAGCSPAYESEGSRKLSVIEQLRFKKEKLTVQLRAVDEALEALEANPGVQKILHLLSKAINY